MSNRKKQRAKREHIIRIRVNEEEWAQLQQNSGASKVSPFLRDLGLRNAIRKEKTPRADPDLIRQLAGIGNNINQLTRTANQLRKEGRRIDALALLSTLDAMQSDIDAIRRHANHEHAPDGSGGE